MKRLRLRLIVPTLLSVVCACAQIPDRSERLESATGVVGTSHTQVRLATQSFDLMAFVPHQTQPNRSDLTIFIEGDGFAWESRHRPSEDPTPITPVVLNMMEQITDRPTAYLGRPCQYLGAQSRNCTTELWTNARYSEPVVAALNEAISLLSSRQNARSLTLVGYSGGGALAALIAPRRNDVTHIVTVAAPLDTHAFTTHHNVSTLTGSLNPADIKSALENLPQTHLSGEQDRIVPYPVLQSFLQRAPRARAATIIQVPGASHQLGWPPLTDILNSPPALPGAGF